MQYLRYIVFLLIVSFNCFIANCQQQPQFSLNIDAGLLRSFKEEQKFWTAGQTISANFHMTPENTVYVSFTYYINGKFENELTAISKSPLTSPQQVPYVSNAKMRFSHISAGWKRYISGDYTRDTKGNVYVYAGLGLMMGKVENVHSVGIDTADYVVPVLAGNGKFKRLTIDPGIGYEALLGGYIYLYAEARTLIPITYYPSEYLYAKKYSPVTAAVHIGFRIFFE